MTDPRLTTEEIVEALRLARYPQGNRRDDLLCAALLQLHDEVMSLEYALEETVERLDWGIDTDG